MYIYIPLMEAPVYPGDIQIIYPEWNEGDPLPEEFEEVILDDRPELNENQIILGLKPNLGSDGKYHLSFVVHNLTPAEIIIRDNKIEKQRIIDKLLIDKESLSEEEARFLADNKDL